MVIPDAVLKERDRMIAEFDTIADRVHNRLEGVVGRSATDGQIKAHDQDVEALAAAGSRVDGANRLIGAMLATS